MKSINFSKSEFQKEDILTRLQMKKVKGGHTSLCVFTWDGDNGCQGGTSSFECTGSGESCQDVVDLICGPNNCCTDVDCRQVN
ncbi:MAG: hypothetical protein A2546_14080 [Sphingobacteriia bacterium RIFOXYD2_FULL_35_12]|nr:MAG: hypothetical protein A2546_14080 [Sphingobacteriia bacterium RIFOXYD2_FULL_35_12]